MEEDDPGEDTWSRDSKTVSSPARPGLPRYNMCKHVSVNLFWRPDRCLAEKPTALFADPTHDRPRSDDPGVGTFGGDSATLQVDLWTPCGPFTTPKSLRRGRPRPGPPNLLMHLKGLNRKSLSKHICSRRKRRLYASSITVFSGGNTDLGP